MERQYVNRCVFKQFADVARNHAEIFHLEKFNVVKSLCRTQIVYGLVYVVQTVQAVLNCDDALGVFAVAYETGEKFKGVEFHF